MTQARGDSMTAAIIRLAIPLIAASYGLVLLSNLIGPLGGAISASGLPGAGLSTLDIAIAIALLTAGGVTLLGGGSRQVAVLAAVTGFAWLGPHLALDPDAPPLSRFAAVGLVPLWPVFVLNLVLAATTHSWLDRRHVAVLVSLYAIAGSVAIARVATYDPFYDPDCASICRHIPALIEPPPDLRVAFRMGAQVVSLITGAIIAAWSLHNLAVRALRRLDGLVLMGGLLSGSAIIGLAIVALADRPLAASIDGLPADALTVLLLWALGAAMLSIAIALVRATITNVRMRVRLRQIADEIEAAPPPGSLGTALAAALGDPTIRVAYWLADDRRYVEPDGAPIDPDEADPDRQSTAIERGGAPVALVAHRTSLDVGALREIGPSMLVALDNERLRAATLAHLRDLQESRARIVEVSDAERQRVERDLHDGAQQGLLAISFDLRLARLNAERAGFVDLAERLADAERISLDAIDELRRVARGVHPAVLSQAGLVLALESLGDDSRIPVDISSDLPGRAPAATEAAAYQVAVDALADAVRRGAHELILRIHGNTRQVILDATDDGAVTTEPAVRIMDRVGASGGRVSITRRPDGLGNVVSAALPCA